MKERNPSEDLKLMNPNKTRKRSRIFFLPEEKGKRRLKRRRHIRNPSSIFFIAFTSSPTFELWIMEKTQNSSGEQQQEQSNRSTETETTLIIRVMSNSWSSWVFGYSFTQVYVDSIRRIIVGFVPHAKQINPFKAHLKGTWSSKVHKSV